MRRVKALTITLLFAATLAISSTAMAKTPRHAPCCKMIHCCKKSMSCCKKGHHACCSGKHKKGGCCCKAGSCPMPKM